MEDGDREESEGGIIIRSNQKSRAQKLMVSRHERAHSVTGLFVTKTSSPGCDVFSEFSFSHGATATNHQP